MLKEQRIIYLDTFTESTDKSKVKPKYKPKGKMPITSFKRIKMSDSSVFDYCKTYKSLTKYIQKILKYKGDGFVFVDEENKNSIVAYVCVQNHCICPIFIYAKYRGYGLSRPIMKMAMNELKATWLWVATDNEVAIKLYKSLGFKIDEKESDDKYLKMTL